MEIDFGSCRRVTFEALPSNIFDFLPIFYKKHKRKKSEHHQLEHSEEIGVGDINEEPAPGVGEEEEVEAVVEDQHVVVVEAGDRQETAVVVVGPRTLVVVAEALAVAGPHVVGAAEEEKVIHQSQGVEETTPIIGQRDNNSRRVSSQCLSLFVTGTCNDVHLWDIISAELVANMLQ